MWAVAPNDKKNKNSNPIHNKKDPTLKNKNLSEVGSLYFPYIRGQDPHLRHCMTFRPEGFMTMTRSIGGLWVGCLAAFLALPVSFPVALPVPVVLLGFIWLLPIMLSLPFTFPVDAEFSVAQT